MAVTFSNHHSLWFAPRLSAFRKPSKTLVFPTIRNSPLRKYNLGFPISLSSSSIARCSFKSEAKTIDGKEGSQISENKPEGEADEKQTSNLQTLIAVYKEAILDEHEKKVSDIEAMIYIMENEKNDLVQKLAELSADLASGKENYIRLKADFENFRKRSEKDRLTLTSNAQEEVIENLLPMVDNFERAKQQIRPETEKEKKIVTSYQGIYKQFVEIMRSLRVAVIETVGKPFDPSLHEAIAREESQEFKEGIVIQEIRRGFLLGDQILRPAMVKVSAGPDRNKNPAAAEKSIGKPTATAGLDDVSVPNR